MPEIQTASESISEQRCSIYIFKCEGDWNGSARQARPTPRAVKRTNVHFAVTNIGMSDELYNYRDYSNASAKPRR
ncbi:hypothetical protein MRX96_002534 [Rhipicephalus microplus]